MARTQHFKSLRKALRWRKRHPHRRVLGVDVASKPKRAKTILLRKKLVKEELALAKMGIREQGNNAGPWVKKFLAEVGLPTGYPWCAAFQSWALDKAAGKKLPIESASVAAFYAYGQQHGWIVKTPKSGDWVCYNWAAAGPPFADHIELVVKVRKYGPVLTMRTVGGNTGSPQGVWLQTRVIAASHVGFVRLPGKVKA